MRRAPHGWIVTLLAVTLAACGAAPPAALAKHRGHIHYKRPPSLATNQWYWELSPSQPGLGGLPATRAAYPNPGSANIWDTDLFQDSNQSDGGIPTGPSPVVRAIHAAGHYSSCYVEAGAYQQGFPDNSHFSRSDYGGLGNRATQMQGYSNEYWFNLTGFRHYVSGRHRTLRGAAPNIAAALDTS